MPDTEKIRAAVFARAASGETLYAREAVLDVIDERSHDTVISTGQWATIRHLVDWIDRANGRTPHEVAMRILKITEENGEVATAHMAMPGQYSRADVADELCDVMLSAAVALVTVAGDTAEDLLAVQWADVRRDTRNFTTCFYEIVASIGRAARTYIGMTGQNPRKGVTHTREDVAAELCDVILAAAVALVLVTDGKAEQVLSAKLAKVAARASKVGA
ncbi:hypothetical protein ACFW9I_03190 [[Kitasatospora] papulosa]|uniref:hypothetical protein n=1 Tax=[Kitasatospora] papulosa TaxID=1464011 RepID=UPI0036C96C38